MDELEAEVNGALKLATDQLLDHLVGSDPVAWSNYANRLKESTHNDDARSLISYSVAVLSIEAANRLRREREKGQ